MSIRKWGRNFELDGRSVKPDISVVISVYNKPRELLYCLEGYRHQSFLLRHPQGLQLILADDGSGPEIEKLFKEFSGTVGFPVTYLRQDHKGWGKLEMLNWSVLESEARQIIFTDGDCVPGVHFVRSHFENYGEKTVNCGRRVDIMEDLANQVTLEDIQKGVLDSNFWVFRHALSRKVDYGGQGFMLPPWCARVIRRFSSHREPTLLGSNFSIDKRWLLKVNGFDESFTVPGIGEDTDLERRLKIIGLEMKWVTYRAIQFHLWHPLTTVGEKSHSIFEELKSKGKSEAEKGIRELQSLIKEDQIPLNPPLEKGEIS